MTVRLPFARSASAVLVLGSTLLGSVGAGDAAPTPTATFDWPLDCPATVIQRHTNPNLDIEVSYEVVIDEAAIPEVIAVEFSPATVDEVSGDGAPGVSAEQLAAYFTNPVIEVEADGSPVEAIGFEEWWERFEPIGGSAQRDEAQMEFEVTRRATITWESWVGVWAAMSDFDGEIVVDSSGDDSATFLAERTAGEQTTLIELVADPDTLQPEAAYHEVRSLDDDVIITYEWWFDWPVCESARSVADLGGGQEVSNVDTGGFETVTVGELPPEALDTLALIEAGGPFPYRQDGAVFENREGLLPDQPFGYYEEYTVETPGSDDRGARRIVAGEGGELYYTDDHYDSFRLVVEQ